MGIVNVTPDSFFAEMRTADGPSAIERGRALLDEGAAIVDVGGESTRPGATPVDDATELDRVIDVIAALSELGPVSVDTTKPTVARAAASAGAVMLNDVSGSLAELAGELGLSWVAMHAQGTPKTMQLDPRYDDVVDEVSTWLTERATAARAAGVDDLWLDPGIGFGKSAKHNWSLLRHLDDLAALASSLDARLMVGTSRKRFLGLVGGRDVPAAERLDASLATAMVAMAAGASMVRVHDVADTVDAARLLTQVPVAS
jgi:dihydropteroate synthase